MTNRTEAPGGGGGHHGGRGSVAGLDESDCRRRGTGKGGGVAWPYSGAARSGGTSSSLRAGGSGNRRRRLQRPWRKKRNRSATANSKKGFNGLEDTRDERIKSMKELAAAYLEEYKLRHRSVTFAEYAVGNVTRHLGELMAVDVTDKTVKTYQTARLKEKAAPKTINEEVGFLLRLLGDAGEPIRARLRRQKALKLATREQVGKAYTPEEKDRATGGGARGAVPCDLPGADAGTQRGDAGCGDSRSSVGPDGPVQSLPHRGGQQDRSRRRPDHSPELRLARSDGGLLEVVHQAIQDHQTGMVRLPGADRQAGTGAEEAARSHEADGYAQDFVEQREGEGEGQGAVAR